LVILKEERFPDKFICWRVQRCKGENCDACWGVE